MAQQHHRAARELLTFYLEAGVDVALRETPVNRFADPAPEPEPAEARPGQAPAITAETAAREPREFFQSARTERTIAGITLQPRGDGRPVTPASAAPPSPDAAIMQAREVARSAASLDELQTILARFEGCALRTTATQLVFADGNPQARVMFVGEAPGRDEDIAGLPFVGVSGKLLDRMLEAIGLDRTKVYIANIVPWRPPGNRTPTPQESATCLPFTLRQIELVDPDVLVCLGQPSTQTLLGTKEGITKTRGRWMTFHTGTRQIRAMPTLHPAYLLRQPLQKRLAWRDFLAIKRAIATPA